MTEFHSTHCAARPYSPCSCEENVDKPFEVRVSGAARKHGINGSHPAETLELARAEGRRLAALCPFARVQIWARGGRYAPEAYVHHETVQEAL